MSAQPNSSAPPTRGDANGDPEAESAEVCGPACDARYHELRSILGAGQTETIVEAARRVMAERRVLSDAMASRSAKDFSGEFNALAERDAARADVAALTQALETAQARIDVLTARADRVRARLAGQETQTEHVITESARRMFEAHCARPDVDFDVESHIADVEAAERARRAGCGR